MADLPVHVGIIMDGNRRWAKERGLSVFEGYREGLENLKRIAKHAASRGIKFLSVFVFSTENWGRKEEEVQGLFSLFYEAVDEHSEELEQENIGILFIGDRDKLPSDMLEKMQEIERRSLRKGNKMTLVIALNYGGRDEIVRAVSYLVDRVFRREKTLEGANAKIQELLRNEGGISSSLDTRLRWVSPRSGEVEGPIVIPDPDLIIRTSGEERKSGFLLWQSAYSEWYWSMKYWPDFTARNFDDALARYCERDRRFGL